MSVISQTWVELLVFEIMYSQILFPTVFQSLNKSLPAEGIIKFILIAENVFNFHSGDKDYYEELYEELSEEEGWAVLINFHPAAQHDFLLRKLNRYVELMDISAWSTYKPEHFFQFIDQKLSQRLDL